MFASLDDRDIGLWRIEAPDGDAIECKGSILRAALAAPAVAQEQPNRRTTGWVAPKDRYVPPVLFNPYTGEPRDVRDVQTDPQGILIVPPGASMLAAPKEGGTHE